MRVVIAGSSGFLGTALRQRLAEEGHEVVRLVRRRAAAADESAWDPYRGELDQEAINSADAVVNLAGAATAGNPHSKKWARQLRESRVTTTRVLAEAVARSATSGKAPALLAGNGISFYGDHGNELLTEDSPTRGDALLTRVAREWQAAADPAVEAGARVCILRTAPVLDRHAPPLKQMIPAFKLGLGTRVGDGRQYFPIISLRDWVGAVTFLIEDPSCSGPFNLCCPIVPTNAEFTHALADLLGRKARLVAPAVAIRVGGGEMAPEVLNSMRGEPEALRRAGYKFHDDDAREVIAAALGS